MPSIALLLALTLAHTPAPTARALNTEGYRLYRAGRLPEALERFRAAAEADPRYALARYNQAATLGALRKQGPQAVCSHDAFRHVITEHLAAAVALDRRRLARAQVDPDFDGVRDTVAYQRLLGLDPARPGDVARLVPRVTWWGPGVGAYGSLVKLRFAARGRVVLERREVGEAGVRAAAPLTGTYRFAPDGKVVLQFPVPVADGQRTLEGTLDARGTLNVTGLGALRDAPSECEA